MALRGGIRSEFPEQPAGSPEPGLLTSHRQSHGGKRGRRSRRTRSEVPGIHGLRPIRSLFGLRQHGQLTTGNPNIKPETSDSYTDGVDLDLQGHFDLGSVGNVGLGRIDTDFSITKILAFVYEQTGSPNLEYVGLQSPYNLSSGAGTPQWRGTFTNTWTDGPVRLSLNVYYISGYKEYGEDIFGPSEATCSTVYTVGFTPPDCRVASFTDVDLTGAYTINDHLQVSFAVENLLDRLPPFDPLTYAGVNYNPTYSQAGIVGRYFRLGFHYKM
jgi:outer membrane receptor protein involved in Fe transport